MLFLRLNYWRMKKIGFLLLLSGFLFSNFILAQNANIRGFVYDKKTGEPAIFCTVVLKGTSLGTSSDINGFYSITKIPPGSYTVMATQIGFDTAYAKITIKGNEVVNQKLFIGETAIDIGTFEVSAEKEEQTTQVKMSVTKLTPKEIKKLPTIGGESDLAQYLQVLPGVVFTGDQGGQLYIRGGTPIQNKVLMDGMIIYNPFHSIGLFSVFDTDIIKNADIYTGGFGAEYGGRISSIMDISTKDGNKKRLSGKVSATTFSTGTLLEGPIFKEKTLGGNSSSFLLSAKHSYLPQSSKLFYTYIDSAGLPYTFTDIYAKASFNSANGSKFNVFGFNFKDGVNYQGVSDLGWNSFGLGSSFVLVPGNSRTLIEGNIAYSQYDISLTEDDQQPRTSGIDGFNVGMGFTNFFGENQTKYGFEILGFSTDFLIFNEANRKIEQNQNTTELAGYWNFRFNKGDFVIEPGLRAQYYASLATTSIEPRFALKYNVGEKENFRIKLATGMYSQNLISANSDRDVVNLFYGFLSGPDNIQSTFLKENGDLKDITHKLQKANHFILGFEYDIIRNVKLNVEGYYKMFTQLTNINRNKIFDDTQDNAAIPDVQKKDFIIETGDAYGVDFSLKYSLKHIDLYAVYSIMKVDRWDGIRKYSPVFDRRHNANFVASWEFGKDLNWELDVRWNLGSGFPFTQTLGFYQNHTFNNDVNYDYTTQNGNLGIQYAEINQGRLPYYHRLDLSLKRTFVISENSLIESTLSVTNAYNRDNVFYFNRVTFERVDQLPLMPSLGVTWKF